MNTLIDESSFDNDSHGVKMKYEVNFGQPVGATKLVNHGSGNLFRVAVLGDFSGRSNTGRLSTGDELANRKAHRVDVDNLDEVLARFEVKLALPIANEGGAVNVAIGCMDDFHPDELYSRLQVFEKLASLRARLQDSAQFANASKVVKSLLGQSAIDQHKQTSKKSKSTFVPNRRMDDFESLVSAAKPPADETPIVDLLKQVVGSFAISAPDPAQDQLVATVDEAISETMRRILHHSDFQAMESLWRSVELLTRRLETGSELQIVLYDVTAEELAADLSASDDLEQSGLFRLLVEQPSLDAQQGPLGLILGNYVFEKSPPHADLLGRMSQIAAAAHAPFIASISSDCINKQSIEEVHPLVKNSWNALHELPSSAYLMLTAPNFMLRWPYGKKTDPIDAFEFEEFTDRGGVSAMLWANSCFLAGLLLSETFLQQGLKSMKLGSIMTMDDMPFYYYVDEHGDQVPLPCTNRLLSESMAAFVISQHFAPVIGIKGRPEVRLGSLKSLSGALLSGPWSDRIPTTTSSPIAPVAQGEMDNLITDPPSETSLNDLNAEGPENDPSGDEATSGMDDLDDLLNDLDGDADSPGTDEPDAPVNDVDGDSDSAADDDLDALLNSMDADNDLPDDGDMDADLAALLADM
ncbi:MAG: type VI secretion system ImpB/VipA family protein [Mariniblastus sp.]